MAAGEPIAGIRLSRNRGHQNALLAGLLAAPGDALVSIDADLQDDVGQIEAMVDRHAEGCDVVYGVRKRRDADTWFKRVTATGFYRLIALMGVETVRDHADYRLLSRRAIEGLRGYGEVNLYLRGIVPLLGFRTAVVEYARSERLAGESKYPLRKMLSLALEAITSFSVVPLRLVTALGLLVSVGSAVVIGWALWTALIANRALPGWTSTVLPIYFLGGVQMLSLGWCTACRCSRRCAWGGRSSAASRTTRGRSWGRRRPEGRGGRVRASAAAASPSRDRATAWVPVITSVSPTRISSCGSTSIIALPPRTIATSFTWSSSSSPVSHSTLPTIGE